MDQVMQDAAMGSLDGKVAFISGGARGQGRSHAVRMAEEGADIITFDLCHQLESVEYPMSTPEDLVETIRLVEQLDRRIVARQADVRVAGEVQAVFDEGLAQFGRVDVVCANAGIMPITGVQSRTPAAWHDAVDVMLTGVYHTCQAAIATLIEQGLGGSIVITSSTAGLKGLNSAWEATSAGGLGYIAAKHGVVGLMRAYAMSLGQYNIRVNTVHPTGVATPMVMNEAFANYVAEFPAVANTMQNILPVELVQPEDISNAIIFLASDAGRYITGVTLPVDAGINAR